LSNDEACPGRVIDGDYRGTGREKPSIPIIHAYRGHTCSRAGSQETDEARHVGEVSARIDNDDRPRSGPGSRRLLSAIREPGVYEAPKCHYRRRVFVGSARH
jgi:hypothetical protein